MNANVTAAFQQHLAQRKANIMNMFTNPHDALGDEVSKAEETEEVEEVEETEEDDGVKKGCGDGDKNIEKEETEEETEEEDEDEKTDAEKAEIISLIGIEQLDVWKDFADINCVEKSDIMYALNGYETKIKFRKSGKEIKEQLNSVVIPALNADLAIAKSEADAVLKECGDAPTHDVPEYWTGDLKIDLDYKFYEWDETRVPDTNNTGIISSFSPESYKSRCCKNAAATQEEADARCKYNECVRKIANITTDVKACEIVAKNLKDNESVELTVRQLVAFKFA